MWVASAASGLNRSTVIVPPMAPRLKQQQGAQQK